MKVLESTWGVQWQWCCKKFSGLAAQGKLDSPGYYLLRDEGDEKVMAFRRPVFTDESRLPEGCVRVVNPELIDHLDERLENSSPY